MQNTMDQGATVTVFTGPSSRIPQSESVRRSRLEAGAIRMGRRWLVMSCLLLAPALPALSQSRTAAAFKNPEDLHYDGGNIQIAASKQPVEWDGHPGVLTNVYSAHYKKDYPASYTPPTIRVNSGTTLNIKLTSKINYTGAVDCEDPHHQYTNLHYHGFEVSPKAPQDDVITIKVTDQPYQYAVVIPPGHPEGMFWYHPHPHGCSFFQVNGGMSGILIVGDILKRQYPELAGIKERILLLKDGDPRPTGAAEQENRVLKFALDQEPEPDPITVNGMSKPVIPINTGEKQFFRIGNVGANFFVKLAFDPPVKATIVAVDGMATDKGLTLPPEGWLLPPGSRVEMVVDGPAPGTYKIISKEIPKAMAPPADTVLATLEAKVVRALRANAAPTKALAQGPRARAAYYPQNEEFKAPPIAEGCDVHSKPVPDPRTQGCTFVFSQGSGEFKINGKIYDEKITDVTCKVGKDVVYDWTLCNDTNEHHAFHIHQIHFQVVDVDGQPMIAPIRDVVDLPPRISKDKVSRTHIKMSFQHDYLAGEFVFHCHMLTHEDKGMMMNISLIP
jgi:suppressor of ftsI